MNKRLHKLERIIRVEYRHFNHIIYPKDFGLELITQITSLLMDRIRLLRYTHEITLQEAHFMRWCASTYYGYYTIQICKYFD